MSSELKYKLDMDVLLSVLRGLRNGIVYGARVRFPHALVMAVFFKEGSIEDKIRGIWRATRQHATSLGVFAVVFKLTRAILRWLRQTDDGLNTFLAGLVGGFIRFGNNDPITSQINMYIMSRVIFGFANILVEEQVVPYTTWNFTAYGALCWGLVMWLYFHKPGMMQKSIEGSMKYIYKDSDRWPALPTTYSGIIDWIYQGVENSRP